MKKYLLFLITIVSLSLAGCSTDDDYCGNGFYRSQQLKEVFNFHPDQFRVDGLKGDSYVVIRSEREFQDKVRGAQYYRGVIDFRYDELIIGQTYVDGFESIIDISPMYKDACNYKSENVLEVDLQLNRGYKYSAYVTYHTVVPRTNSDRYNVRTFIRYR